MQLWQLLQIQRFCILGKVISNIKSLECGTGGGEMLQPLLEKPPTAKKKKLTALFPFILLQEELPLSVPNSKTELSHVNVTTPLSSVFIMHEALDLFQSAP